MRKVNADDKRQAAELIELDGGDLRRGPLDTRKAALTLLLKQAAPRPAAQRTGLLHGDAGAFGPRALTLRRSVSCHPAVVIWLPRKGRPLCQND